MINKKLKFGIILGLSIFVLFFDVFFFVTIKIFDKFRCEVPKIEDVNIEKFEEYNEYQISWTTEIPTTGRIEIDNTLNEQEKINSILQDSFSCKFDKNLTFESGYNDLIKNKCKIYNSYLSTHSNEYTLYAPISVTDKPLLNSKAYIGGIVRYEDDTYPVSKFKKHSIKLHILKPNETYNIKVVSGYDCNLGDNYIEKIIKIPESD